MISTWILLSVFAWAEAPSGCDESTLSQFQSIEFKLNLDGQGTLDAIALYGNGREGQEACQRRAVIFDAPEDFASVKPEHWLGPADYADPSLRANQVEVAKRSVEGRDLLLVHEEIGDYQSHTYYEGRGQKLSKVFAHAHKPYDGQVTEYPKKKSLELKVFDTGTLEVNGQAVDLDQRAIKLRCRVRELYVQIKYRWDSKESRFVTAEEGCVMGPAID